MARVGQLPSRENIAHLHSDGKLAHPFYTRSRTVRSSRRRRRNAPGAPPRTAEAKRMDGADFLVGPSLWILGGQWVGVKRI